MLLMHDGKMVTNAMVLLGPDRGQLLLPVPFPVGMTSQGTK